MQSAIERFVNVGEKIAAEHAEIKYEMFDACVLVRQAGEFRLLLSECSCNVGAITLVM